MRTTLSDAKDILGTKCTFSKTIDRDWNFWSGVVFFRRHLHKLLVSHAGLALFYPTVGQLVKSGLTLLLEQFRKEAAVWPLSMQCASSPTDKVTSKILSGVSYSYPC